MNARTITMEENAFLRAAPDPNARAVGLALRGDVLPAAGPPADGYAPVGYRGGVAWVRMSALRP